MAAMPMVAMVATVDAGAPSRASGRSSERDIRSIAPAAKPRPIGKNPLNCSTKRNAGMAMSGCGRDVNMLHRPACRRLKPLDVMTVDIAKPSGILCRAIASAMKIPKLSAGSNETPMATPSAKEWRVMTPTIRRIFLVSKLLRLRIWRCSYLLRNLSAKSMKTNPRRMPPITPHAHRESHKVMLSSP
jgi:hypothetical protein